MDLLHFTDLLQPQWYVANGGVLLIMFIVFAETGLFAGFFLPGDSLLFVTGVYSHKLMEELLPGHSHWFNLLMLILLISLSGILGNMFGYYFGKKGGEKLYDQKDTFFFKHKYLRDAKSYFDKHGPLTIFLARFIPFVRTFAPIVAGIVKMEYKKFMFYNIAGCFAWTTSFILPGHYLHGYLISNFQLDITEYLGYIVLAIVIFTTVPFLIKMNRLKGP